MLSFLGAIHWGLEFGKFGGSHGHPRCVPSLPVHFFRTASHEPDEELLFVLLVGRLLRLALGVLPLAYAWPTLYLLNPTTALVAQWAGFLASWGLDRWAGSNGWGAFLPPPSCFFLPSLP